MDQGASLGIEAGGWFVRQHNGWGKQQSTRDGHTLHLPAGHPGNWCLPIVHPYTRQ